MSNITTKIDSIYGNVTINWLFNKPIELGFFEANILKKRLNNNVKFPFLKLKFYQTDFENVIITTRQKEMILSILNNIPKVS